MPLYNFNFNQPLASINESPDMRTESEKMLTLAAVYNPTNPDISMAERLAEELCNVSGALVKVWLRTDNEVNADDTWDEDPNPTYYNPIWLKGVWIPKPLKDELTKFGVDADTESAISFCRAVLLNDLPRTLRAGDLIQLPQNAARTDYKLDIQENLLNYEVLVAEDNGSYRYRWLYVKCTVRPFSGDFTLLPHGR